MLKTNKEFYNKLINIDGVQSIKFEGTDIKINFKPEHTRTGQELLNVQKLLFDFKVYNFIKSEKVDLFSGTLKEITIYL